MIKVKHVDSMLQVIAATPLELIFDFFHTDTNTRILQTR